MSEQARKNRSAAWRTAAIGCGLIVVYISGVAQGMKHCLSGWPF